VLVVLIIVGALLNSHFLTVLQPHRESASRSPRSAWWSWGESLILLTGGLDLSLEATYGPGADGRRVGLIVPVASFGAGTMLNPYLGILILLAVGGGGRVRQRGC